MVMVEISAPGKGLPTPSDHTGSPGNFPGLFFVHGKSLSNAVLPMFFDLAEARKYWKELSPCCSRAEALNLNQTPQKCK